MVKAVFFDLWDTLIYLENGWKTFNILKEELDIDRKYWRSSIKPLFLCENHHSVSSFLERFIEHTNIQLNFTEWETKIQKQLEYDLEHTLIYDDVLDTLKQLKNNDIKLGIISNQSTLFTKSFYNLGLDRYFDYILFSSELNCRKPDDEIYAKIDTITGLSRNEVLIVGDNIKNDYLVPLKKGFNAIYLDRNNSRVNSDYVTISTLDNIMRYINNDK